MAETFLRIFPEAAFLCLHRNLAGVFADGTAAYPWGLGGSPFWAFAGPHPGNNVATIASFWAACTESLLDFETAHPQSCLRVRCEDLDTDPGGQASKIFGHLGIEAPLSMAPDPSPPTRPSAGPAEAAAAIPPETCRHHCWPRSPACIPGWTIACHGPAPSTPWLPAAVLAAREPVTSPRGGSRTEDQPAATGREH